MSLGSSTTGFSLPSTLGFGSAVLQWINKVRWSFKEVGKPIELAKLSLRTQLIIQAQ
jgi:hypothetical protein